ncbi:MAG: acyl-CoA dehydrogenase family protein [Cyanobacteria bacterium P01_F01_bin.4]
MVNTINLQKIDVQDYLAVAAKVGQQLAVNAVQQDAEAGIPTVEVEALKRTGLLLLPIPREYGGAGARFPEVYQVVKTLAKAQGSVGQLYANHATLVHAAAAIGRPGQAEHYYRLTTEQNLFWANALNARDARLKIEPEGNSFRVNGIKSFGTGVAAADINAIAALHGDQPMVFIIPKDRPGIRYNHDWNNLGQRRTASGSYTFENVYVAADELVGPPPVPESAFPTLIFLVSQLGKVFTYLGIAEGALDAAKGYTTAKTRPWLTSGVDKATDDPFILHRYGEYWTDLQAAIALAERAADKLQTAWEKGTDLTFEERGEVAIAAASAKAFAIKVGVNITSQIFELMGARATAAHYGFDRYWRDLRTFSLHDPVDYKFKAIGEWVVNGVYPMPSQYA